MSKVGYRKANTAPVGGPSPIIWADCPVVAMQKDPGKGVHIFEDFIGKIVDLAAAGQYGQFYVVETGDGVAVTQDTDAYDGEHGVAKLVPTGTGQYDEAYFVSPVLYELKLDSKRKFWFETRIKLPNVLDDMSLLVGLGENDMLDGASLIEASVTPDTIEDKDFIGFVAFTDGTNIHDIDAIYSEDGDAAVTQVKNAARAQAEWTNDEYVKLGMRYDGLQYVKFYIDGVLVGTLDVADLDTGTANQLTDPLGVIVGCSDHDTTAPHLDVDWIRFAFER